MYDRDRRGGVRRPKSKYARSSRGNEAHFSFSEEIRPGGGCRLERGESIVFTRAWTEEDRTASLGGHHRNCPESALIAQASRGKKQYGAKRDRAS